jgi:hypothetical protein
MTDESAFSQYDEKGKLFTPVITKKPIAVIIQTETHLIEGNIYIRPGERLLDDINQGENFLAVTDATISQTNGKVLHRTNFMAVNRTQILWLLSKEELHK